MPSLNGVNAVEVYEVSEYLKNQRVYGSKPQMIIMRFHLRLANW